MTPVRRDGWISIVLILATVAVFGSVGRHEFVMWDDNVNVYENPHLGPASMGPARFWKGPYEDLYIPVTYTMWAIEARFSRIFWADWSGDKLHPRLFHLTNLILHLLSVLVVYRILRVVVRENRAAGLGALLFAVHPVQVEPVAWVTGMKDVLCGLFSLLAVWQYLVYVGAEGHDQSRRRIHYAAASLSFGLALLSKPSAVVVPLIAGILAGWTFRKSFKEIAISLSGWVAVSIAVTTLTRLVQPEDPLRFVPPVWARFFVAGDAVTFYLKKLAAPVDLGPDYGRSTSSVLREGWVYLAGLIPCALAAVLWRWRNHVGWIGIAAVVWVVSLLPVLGFVPFGFQQYSTVADRYLYFSMLGPALALAGSIAVRRSKSIGVLCLLALAVLGVHSACHARVWRDNRSIFTHALKINPNSWMAHNNLGLVLASEGNYAEAIAHYTEALRINPGHVDSIVNTGTALAALGDREESLDHFFRALEIQPDNVEARINLGSAYVSMENFDEAWKHFSEALRLRPDHSGNADVHCDLGIILIKQGSIEEGMRHYEAALKIRPDHLGAAYNLAVTLSNLEKFDAAAARYSEILRIAPAHLNARINLGVVLARLGNLDAAIAQFSEALRIQPGHPEAGHNLQRALALRGKNPR